MYIHIYIKDLKNKYAGNHDQSIWVTAILKYNVIVAKSSAHTFWGR